MMNFLDRLRDPRPILLDGATGTELYRRGVETLLPLWSASAILDAPDTLLEIHQDYLRAGAEVITTNTFRTHRRTLEKAGMGENARELTTKAVEIARRAVDLHLADRGHPAWVAGSVAPLEDCYSPELVPSQNECIDEHQEMFANLTNAGVDLILIETMNTIREAEAAALAAQKSELPFIVSFVLGPDNKLLSGESLRDAAKTLEEYSPIMIGVNCSPVQTMTGALNELGSHTRLPIAGYGNIGHIDTIHGWANSDEISPKQYAGVTKEWDAINIGMLGGCCGTSPAHIRSIHATISQLVSK